VPSKRIFLIANGIARRVKMDSIIGGNILNCSFRYKVSLDDILNFYFQPRDIYSYHRAKVGSSALLSSLIELLQCRDGSLSLLSS